MGTRTINVLTLAALPANDAARTTMYAALVVAALDEGRVQAKFTDFVARKFITSEDPATAVLTTRGQTALASIE